MKKKNYLLITSSLAILLSCYVSQGYAQSKIAISFSSFGENFVSRYKPLVGTASTDITAFYSFGLNYIRPINRHFEWETGLEIASNKLQVNPNLDPTIDYVVPPENYYLINVPLNVRLNFLRYFFLNGGILFDIDPNISGSIDNQTGIGANFGLGLNYSFTSGFSIFLNPYTKLHALLPFTVESHHQRIFESAVRFGIAFPF